MVFGMCANRVIGFAVALVKDVVTAKAGVAAGTDNVAGPRVEEITTEEKKTI